MDCETTKAIAVLKAWFDAQNLTLVDELRLLGAVTTLRVLMERYSK